MNRFQKILEQVSTVSAWIGIALTLVTMGMYAIDVVGRLFFSTQMKGTFEIAQFMFCIITFSAYAYTQMSRGHIHVGFVMIHFVPRLRYCVSAVNFVLCTVFCSIVSYNLFNMGNVALASNKHSQVVSLPFAPLYFISAVFMALFTVTLFFDIIRSIQATAGNSEARTSIDKLYSG